MSATDLTAATVTCPKCQAANAAGARFCFVCGAALQPASANGGSPGFQPPLPPPVPLPPPIPAPPPSTGMLGGGGSAAQGLLAVDAPTAFSAALRAVQDAKGTLTAQQPPYALRFQIVKRGFWSTGGLRLRYDGELALAPQGARQTATRVTLKLDSSGRTQILMSYAVACLALMIFWSGFGLIIGLAGLAFAWHKYVNTVPNEMAETLSTALSAAAGATQAAYPTPAAPIPAPMPAPMQPPAPRAEESNGATSVVEQLKQLGQLRDLGVVTVEEFEAKKAELLRRL